MLIIIIIIIIILLLIELKCGKDTYVAAVFQIKSFQLMTALRAHNTPVLLHNNCVWYYDITFIEMRKAAHWPG